ncbi:hypothetical protein SmaMPs15_000047 [Stenotrophomonas maltophilia phage vB_SmaM_Ps15]|uniref:Uncharacterized protein n=1 Tax=Stenotrophomonas maltophilia phage vB_SmaM_Ps15 TaxID=3071007 RepID=A0AAE9FH75_9CAUD|nr:hypothetical protein PQC01_gp047 [Stenotrophomonas maltophilia phage vB_SmaM_Ps15]UMO77198.1 hypothetical protein SmaMPs15_000047 [Stenotrophomonas maltophilia phage vB_SmaM_Ps15]
MKIDLTHDEIDALHDLIDDSDGYHLYKSILEKLTAAIESRTYEICLEDGFGDVYVVTEKPDYLSAREVVKTMNAARGRTSTQYFHRIKEEI